LIGLILDTLVIMILVQVLTGQESDSYGKTAVVALLAAVALAMASTAARHTDPTSAMTILLSTCLGVGAFVAIGSWLLLSVKPSKAALVGVLFIVYKLLISILFSVLFG